MCAKGINMIALRAANPTFEEGMLFAQYLDEAAEGFFRFMLGERFKQILAEAYIQPAHDLSFQNVTFAEHNNVLVGMVSGYTAEQHRSSTREPLKQAAGKNNIRMRIVLVLFAPLMRIVDSMAEDDFYLQAIAVDKDQRGSGIGSILADYIEEQARARGSKRLALDVSSSNSGACQFYNNRGMAVTSQWPRQLKIPKLKFYRMTKTL
jgi:ribosomal protein S18 acetylase RimI-like enzyme